MPGPIIVGVDGSASARTAMDLAADSAVLRGLDLELLHAFNQPLIYPPMVPPAEPPPPLPRGVADALLAHAADRVRERHPRLTIRTTVVDGHPGGVLVDATRRAEFLYVGHRGLGGFAELLLGSVGVSVITHGQCPIVVVRGEPPRPDAPIVVGVDGSVGARTALRVALEEARLRGVHLAVVLVWPPARTWPEAVTAAGLPRGAASYDPLAVSTEGIVQDFPDVKFSTEVRHSPAPPEMLATVAAESGAGLVVVGSRGGGGFRGLLLGGTSRVLVDHAPCPVMVVPDHATST